MKTFFVVLIRIYSVYMMLSMLSIFVAYNKLWIMHTRVERVFMIIYCGRAYSIYVCTGADKHFPLFAFHGVTYHLGGLA